MAKKSQYEYQGSVHHFKKKPPQKDNDWLWGVGFAVVILFLIGSCS